MRPLRSRASWLVGAAWLLGAGCSEDERDSSRGDAGNTGGGATRDAQADLDAGSSGAAGATVDGGGIFGHCAVMGQVQNAATGFCECPVRLPDACPDACVDLLHDAEHCGDCDTACEPGAGCRAGSCAESPTEVATLDGCMNPRMISSDGVFYISDTGTGKISVVTVDGDAATVTDLVTDQVLADPARPMRTSALAIDADSLYWSNLGDNTLMKVPLSGGTPEMLIELDAPARGLAVGGGSVFFTHHADVFKIPSSGLAPDAGVGTPPTEIDCEETGLQPVRGEAVAGATFVASSNDSCIPNGEAAAIALTDSAVLYIIDRHGALDQNSQSGDEHLRLILGDDVGPARDVIALNATHAFAAGYSAVLRAKLGERQYEAVVYAVDSGITTGFTITDSHVYVASDRGGISRASIEPPTDNTQVVSEQLVRDQQTPRWLANDGTNLYWITSDCRIMSVAMPP